MGAKAARKMLVQLTQAEEDFHQQNRRFHLVFISINLFLRPVLQKSFALEPIL